MCQGDKHNLLDCLEGTVTNRHDTSLDVDGKVLDGPAVVHLQVPGACGTFEDYAKEDFLPYAVKELESNDLHCGY